MGLQEFKESAENPYAKTYSPYWVISILYIVLVLMLLTGLVGL